MGVSGSKLTVYTLEWHCVRQALSLVYHLDISSSSEAMKALCEAEDGHFDIWKHR